MYNTISPVNFNGSWQILEKKVVPKYLTSEGARIVVHPIVYHPEVGESAAEIKSAMNKLHSGWCYSIWKLHPNGGKRNGDGIYEIYKPIIGDIVGAEQAKDLTPNDVMIKIANVDIDETTFKANHNADSFRVYDVDKLDKKRIVELVKKYKKYLNM